MVVVGNEVRMFRGGQISQVTERTVVVFQSEQTGEALENFEKRCDVIGHVLKVSLCMLY